MTKVVITVRRGTVAVEGNVKCATRIQGSGDPETWYVLETLR